MISSSGHYGHQECTEYMHTQRWRQGDQEFEIILSYLATQRPALLYPKPGLVLSQCSDFSVRIPWEVLGLRPLVPVSVVQSI